jgi:hypothetical protein
VTVNGLHNQIGDLGLEFYVHVEHNLRALPVKLFDRGPASLLGGFAKKLLEQPVLLVCRIARKVQRNHRVCAGHGLHSLRAFAHWIL